VKEERPHSCKESALFPLVLEKRSTWEELFCTLLVGEEPLEAEPNYKVLKLSQKRTFSSLSFEVTHKLPKKG